MTTEEAGIEVPADGVGPEAELPPDQVPFILLCVFGLPIFMTLIWFFLRFTSPDRGAMQLRAMKALEEDESEAEEPGEE